MGQKMVIFSDITPLKRPVYAVSNHSSNRLIPTFETLQHVRVVAQAATFFVEIVVDFHRKNTFPYLSGNQSVMIDSILLRGKSRFTRHKLGVYPE